MHNLRDDFLFCTCCTEPTQVRPDIVWFGEMPMHLDEIYEAVEKCDFSMVNDLVEVLKKPFKSSKKVNLIDPPKPGEDIKNTFCGT